VARTVQALFFSRHGGEDQRAGELLGGEQAGEFEHHGDA
jgi:hypothetical protein